MERIKRNYTLFGGVWFGLALVWVALSVVLFPRQSGTEQAAAPQKGFHAPDFTLQTRDAGELSLSDLHGKIVLLNFWASWCLPCRSEMPDIQAVYEEYAADGFVVLGVDAPNDSPMEAVEFMDSLGVTFPVVFDSSGSVSRAYAINALPTSFFIDQAGVIRQVVVGGPLSEAYLQVQVEMLLAGEGE